MLMVAMFYIFYILQISPFVFYPFEHTSFININLRNKNTFLINICNAIIIGAA